MKCITKSFYALKIMTIVIIIEGLGAVSDYCGAMPEIQFANSNKHGIRFKNGDVARFSCLSGYAPIGKEVYECTNGTWIGGPFYCQIKNCSVLESPRNGKRLGNSYEAGSIMRFKCETGYELVGSPTMQCNTNAEWDPPNIPNCQRKKCPTKPVIRNGFVVTVVKKENADAQTNVYGTVLKVQCFERFIRNGPAIISCTEKGQWTAVPTCELVSCPPFPSLDSNCVKELNLVVLSKTLLFLYCEENSTRTGNDTAECKNNAWDDMTLGCWCDCPVKPNNDLVLLENMNPGGLLKHGETLNWTCNNGSRKNTFEQLTCKDGSIETPHCIPDRAADTVHVLVVIVLAVIVLVVIVIVLFAKISAVRMRCQGQSLDNCRIRLLGICNDQVENKTDEEIPPLSNSYSEVQTPSDDTHEEMTLLKQNGNEVETQSDHTDEKITPLNPNGNEVNPPLDNTDEATTPLNHNSKGVETPLDDTDEETTPLNHNGNKENPPLEDSYEEITHSYHNGNKNTTSLDNGIPVKKRQNSPMTKRKDTPEMHENIRICCMCKKLIDSKQKQPEKICKRCAGELILKVSGKGR